MDYGLGRLPSVDLRDKNFPMKLALVQQTLPTYKYWKTGPVLDQGNQPFCVGYSWRQWLTTAPLMTRSGPDAPTIYHEAQVNDEWPGEDYDGTSVRGGAKALEIRGHIATYLWATTKTELTEWVLTKGPAVVGTWWYSSMFTPNADGFVFPSGSLEGGHAYIIIGYNSLSKVYRCMNSWGSSWGQKGRFWIKEDDMHQLIFDEDGEACAAIERKIV